MTFWWIIAAIALAAVVPLLWPLLRPPRKMASHLDHDLEVYRDQLAELDAEANAGTVSEQEAREARREIERRILRAADAGAGSDPAGTVIPSPIAAVAIALIVPAFAVLVYASLGTPGETAPPAAGPTMAANLTAPATRDTAQQQAAPPLERVIQRLSERLAGDTEDLQGWTLLGRAYWETGRYAKAADAYGRAVALDGDDPALQVAYGESIVASTDGMVTPLAKVAFERARDLDPTHVGARYYLALSDLQAGRPQYAYDSWLALARDLEPGSDAFRTVVGQLQRVAADLELDLAADLPQINQPAPSDAASRAPRGPTQDDVAAAAEMSGEDRQQFIRSMVQRLADRLADQPDDFDGWMRLGRAYGVLGETARSADAYGRAANLRPGDPAPLEFQAAALLQAGDTNDGPPQPAIEVLRQLAQLQPDNPRVLWYLGLDEARSGDISGALDKWRRLRRHVPEGTEQRRSLEAGIAELEQQLN